MPSQPFDTGWDFGPDLDLIDSDLSIEPHTNSSTSQTTIPINPVKHIKKRSSAQSLHLGDFTKLFERLGISNREPLPPLSPVEPDSEDPTSADDILQLSSDQTEDNATGRDNTVDCSLYPAELSDLVEEPHAGMTRTQLQKERKKERKEKKEAAREHKAQE